MDGSQLALAMLDWERKRRELDALEQQIRDAVLDLGKTQTVGNVRATYSGGRRSFNYQAAADGHPMVSEATVALFSSVVTTVDWAGICKHVGIEDIPFTQSAPSVTVKLLQ